MANSHIKYSLIKTITLLLVIIQVGSGCSFLASSNQKITIMSNVPDAYVYVNAKKIGTGNLSTVVRRESGTQIMLTKEGYQPAYYTLDRELRTIGYIDIGAGAFLLVPFLGLLAPGAYTLYPKNVVLELQPSANK